MEFTEHQVRVGLAEIGEHDDRTIDDAIEVMRATSPAPGALGFTDDELKGVARDEWKVIVNGEPEAVAWSKVAELGVRGPQRYGLAERMGEGAATSLAAELVNHGIDAEACRHDDLSRAARRA